jgi:HAD superfamily hydrolase (TIGR01509 family)
VTPSITGVIFDLDGTLYRLRKTKVRLTLLLWRTIPVLRHLGGARRAIRDSLYENKESLDDAFFEALGQMSHISAERAATWYHDEFMRAFVGLLERNAYARPGLLQLLERLRRAGVKLAVVSDIGRVEDRLRAIGVPPEIFDALLAAEDVGALKPSPRSLLTVAERWGLDPSEILVVGDRLDRDAEAAKAAGMSTLIVDGRAPSAGRRHETGATLMPWKDMTRAIASRAGLE